MWCAANSVTAWRRSPIPCCSRTRGEDNIAATSSVLSAFRVLEAVADAQPVGLSELARSVELPKSTVQRVLLTLQELGWLSATDSAPARWRLTYRAAAVAGRAGAADGLRDIARPVMNELQAATTETVHLAAPDGQTLVLILRLDSPHPLRAFTALGERFALHASAAGLAYLSACGEDITDDYLAAVTHVDPADIRTVLGETRRRGYAVSVDEMSSGISSIGAPIVGSAGPVAALSVSGPSSRIGAQRFEELGARVRDAALRISGAMYQRRDG